MARPTKPRNSRGAKKRRPPHVSSNNGGPDPGRSWRDALPALGGALNIIAAIINRWRL